MQHWIDRSGIARQPMPKLAETAEGALAWELETGAVQAYRVALAASLAAATFRLCAKPNTSESPSATFVESAIPSTLEPSPAATDAAANPPGPHSSARACGTARRKELERAPGFARPPTEELDQPLGKRWRYREGQCTGSFRTPDEAVRSPFVRCKER